MALITIPAARRTDWTPGTKTGVVGGIAQYRPGGANQRVTQVNVVTYGADPTGVADSGPGIRAAIAAASAGQVVWHYTLIRQRSREGCFKAFRLNHWLGLSVFVGVVLSTL